MRLLLMLLFLPISAFACLHDCRESEEGTQLIRSFEGYFPFIYYDVAGYPTLGFGHMVKPGEHFQEPLMGPDAEKLLRSDIAPAERGVNRYVAIDLLQPQFDAATSFAFNLGVGTLYRSSLLRVINAKGCPKQQFLLYDKARVNGSLIIVKGLHRRRVAESNLWICK